MIELGLKDLGYKYLTIDDCWQANERENDHLAVDEKFPNGFHDIGKYIHKKGLHFGLGTSAGDKTCHKRPGSLGHEEMDAADFAEWGVSYVKYYGCGDNGAKSDIDRFTTMSRALQ